MYKGKMKQTGGAEVLRPFPAASDRRGLRLFKDYCSSCLSGRSILCSYIIYLAWIAAVVPTLIVLGSPVIDSIMGRISSDKWGIVLGIAIAMNVLLGAIAAIDVFYYERKLPILIILWLAAVGIALMLFCVGFVMFMR